MQSTIKPVSYIVNSCSVKLLIINLIPLITRCIECQIFRSIVICYKQVVYRAEIISVEIVYKIISVFKDTFVSLIVYNITSPFAYSSCGQLTVYCSSSLNINLAYLATANKYEEGTSNPFDPSVDGEKSLYIFTLSG